MRVTIQLNLEEVDSPKFCNRVNDALEKLLRDGYFAAGAFRSGHNWVFHLEGVPTFVNAFYETDEAQ